MNSFKITKIERQEVKVSWWGMNETGEVNCSCIFGNEEDAIEFEKENKEKYNV